MKPHLRLRFTALLTLLIALPHIASAYSFESGGVYYDITSSTEMTVRVTYSNRNNNDYSGIVNIPTSVVYGGNRYFVTAIGDYAFSGCTLLDKVVITANQLTTIGNYAFSGCNGLAEFTVPSKVTSIGNYAFNGCFSLENLTFAKTTKTLSLGYGSSEGQSHALFEDCPLHRVEVTRPLSYSTSSSYGYSPFARQEDLSEIIFDEDITSIPPNMFCLNTAITSYVVPDHITEIGDLAFNGSYIRSITIHNQVTRIGESAFYGSPLKSLVIPPSVFRDCPLISVFVGRMLSYNTSNHCGYSPFANITTLTTARLGNPVNRIQKYLFAGCKSLKTVNYNENCKPKDIGAYAFWSCTSLTESDIVLPTSITAIGEGAFKNCTGLLGYTIPNHIKTVEESAFMDCSKLENLIIKPSVEAISNYAFNGCTSLSQLTIEEGEQPLSLGYNSYNDWVDGNGMFRDCPLISVFVGRMLSYNTSNLCGYSPFANITTLTTVRFGNPVVRIQNYLFAGCKSLKTVNYNENCKPKDIGAYAFWSCTSLTESDIVLPTSITVFGEGAFKNCAGLLGFTIPNHIKTVGANAFRDCSNLKNLIIKPSVEAISNYAFNGCTSLSQLTMFRDCPLISVFVGRMLSYNTSNHCGYSPFANITTLTAAQFGNVKQIGASLFRSCSKLSCITIPATVNAIGDYAFNGCTKLLSVTALPLTPPLINDNCFSDETYTAATLTVDFNAMPLYQQATGWKKFFNIVGQDTGLTGDVDGNGSVNGTDLNILINILLGKDNAENYNGRANVDAQGNVDGNDLNAIINILLGK